MASGLLAVFALATVTAAAPEWFGYHGYISKDISKLLFLEVL
jgi:hypothetical protein